MAYINDITAANNEINCETNFFLLKITILWDSHFSYGHRFATHTHTLQVSTQSILRKF